MDNYKYFSVMYAVRILGMRFAPTVCYKMDDMIEPTIRKMASDGVAKLYAEKVRFVNGTAVPIGRKEAVKLDAQETATESASEQKPGGKKKDKRLFS